MATFAARYRAGRLGITAATAIVHLISVGLGRFVGDQFADREHHLLTAGIASPVFAA